MSKTIKIEKRILATKVVKKDDVAAQAAQSETVPTVVRGDVLRGFTYKIKPSAPYSGHALYITCNAAVLNEGQDNEKLVPYEVFINSKDMTNFEWIVGLTRVISGVFRTGADATFLVEELTSIANPAGGFYPGKNSGLPQGRYIGSLVAAVGMVLERFFTDIGIMQKGETQAYGENVESVSANNEEERPARPQCPKCQQFSLIMQAGCQQCENCDYNKCE